MSASSLMWLGLLAFLLVLVVVPLVTGHFLWKQEQRRTWKEHEKKRDNLMENRL